MPPGENNIKMGKCKRFVFDPILDIGTPYTPGYFVTGIPDTAHYADAIVCRTLSHMCGINGYCHTPLDGFG
jgi:hypothetical protein